MKITFYSSKKYDIDYFKKYDLNNEFKYYTDSLNVDTVELAKGSDAICIFVNDVVDKDIIDKLYELNIKLILLRCAGYNNVDIEYCFNKIHVFRVPAYSPYAIAEHAMALLLTLNRNTHKAYIRTRNFNFSIEQLDGFDLHNKTIGVIGTGKIGKCFINICKGFGLNVIAYDKYHSENIEYVALDELYKRSDIISLHCPLTSDTYHMINSDTINVMQRKPIIINTSRGGLINSIDLLHALKNKQLKGACLDVYEEESNIFFKDYSSEIMDDETLQGLINLPNVLITSHQAYLTAEALDNIANTTVENYKTYFKQGYGDNELCYHCGKVEECMKNRKKCF